MYPNQPGPPQQQWQPQQQYTQQSYVVPGQNTPPDKRLVIGGGIVLVIILSIIGMLLFGGNDADKIAWNNLVYSEAQIPAITARYNDDIQSLQLNNTGASIQATWLSNNADMVQTYKSVVGKDARSPSSSLDKEIKESLDDSKVAGNLDADYAEALIKQLNLVNKNINTLLAGDISQKTRTQLKDTQELVKTSLDQLDGDQTSSSD